jgi:uncharacterized RDD family membrane protein YckC
MSSGLDQVLEDKQAQEFWLRRLVAYIIDSLIIFIPITVMASIAWSIGFFGQVSWVISGALLVGYTALFESELGYTIGKRIMGLEVVSLDPRPYDFQRALIRNITKVHNVFLLIDLLLGVLAENRANMRYLDTVVATEVVDQEVAEWRRAHGMAPPPGDGQGPAVTVQPDAPPPEPTMPPEPGPAPPPEPPSDDLVVEEPPDDTGAPGIAPPPIPPEEAPEVSGEKEELEELSMDEIMDGGPEEPEPAYRMPRPEKK